MTATTAQPNVAEQLEQRLVVIADPRRRFTPGYPRRRGDTSLYWDWRAANGHQPDPYEDPVSTPLDWQAVTFLGDFTREYFAGTNQFGPRNRWEAIWMLEEAIVDAKDQGL